MSSIRQMRNEDLDPIRLVEVEAFSAWWNKLTEGSAALPQRTHTNILACRHKDPEGCFVAQVENYLVGFIFSRTWGKVGWFGTFAVLPKFQGCGIGKGLIHASLGYLRESGVSVIGLETMPESPFNLGLYLKMGFRPGLLTFQLTKSLGNPHPEVELPCWSSVNPKRQAHWITGLRMVSEQIPPGFDFTKEIIHTAQYNQGETLVLTDDDRAFGMSTIWLQTQRLGGGDERASVQVLTLHPSHTNVDTFHTLILASEALAQTHGKQMLTIPVNARHAWALQRLLEWGYRVERAMVRMTLESMDEEPPTDDLVNCSRWAG